MAYIETSSLINGTTATETRNGREITQVLIVADVTTAPHQRVITAMTTAGVPRVDDPYAGDSNCICESVNAIPLDDPTIFQVTCVFKEKQKAEEQYTEDISASVQSAETTTDVDGELLAVRHKKRADQPLWDVQVATVDIQKPQLRRTISRIENTEPLTPEFYIGKVNVAGWRGYPARTWLMTDITSKEREDGRFDVQYVLAYQADTWDKIIWYRDPDTDKVPVDVVPGEGAKYYQLYEEWDFGGIGL
ncbi:MAG TPA: hypothetical protein VEK08_00455 [Planctomycetota bacterium]|nr:hypothetical protein [Planctomycetota bacterium]